MATNSELTNSTAAVTNIASLATEKMELTGNFMGILGDISAEEIAIMIAQIHEDELSHTPNVGDPIRPDIVTSHEEFLAKHVAIVRTCFGDNFGLLCNLVNGNTEKNVANVYFQRSDLHRMLSTKMYRDNSMEMHSKVLAVRCATGTTPKKVYFVPLFWYPTISTPSFRGGFLNELPYLDSFDWIIRENKHWQNGVKGEGYHSHKQHVPILAWRSERSPLVLLIGERINKVAAKLSRSWLWDEQLSFVLAPSQLTNTNDCGPAVNELGRRLMWNENLVDFDLAGAGKLL